MAPQHFLVVAFPGQGHINPARALAERLARTTPGARVTLSAAVSAHRLMFPSLASPDEEIHDGAISYIPYSDGYDHGFRLFAGDGEDDDERSMVVEWCDQVRVLSHPAVGCFVTHCGWNSTLESMACGAPVVAVPQWSDQDTNARLVVEWGIGVRATIDADRFLDAEELTRCVEMVMGDTEEGAAIRRRSTACKAKVQEAISDGGSSENNLRTFQGHFANDA